MQLNKILSTVFKTDASSSGLNQAAWLVFRVVVSIMMVHNGVNKFEDIEFYLGPETGCPVIKDTLGYVECRVVGAVEHGDHTVFVGEVVGAAIHREGEPLLLESTGWNYGG